jgi:hypothetical protein
LHPPPQMVARLRSHACPALDLAVGLVLLAL